MRVKKNNKPSPSHQHSYKWYRWYRPFPNGWFMTLFHLHYWSCVHQLSDSALGTTKLIFAKTLLLKDPHCNCYNLCFFFRKPCFSQKHVACLSIHIPWYLYVLVLPPNCCCIPRYRYDPHLHLRVAGYHSPHRQKLRTNSPALTTSPWTPWDPQGDPLGPLGTCLHAIHAFPNATFDVSDLQPWLDMAWRRKKHGTSHETQKMPLSLISFMLVGYLGV